MVHQKLKNIEIVTHFQPIISIKKKSIIGIEALSRGYDTITKEMISPLQMFKYAAERSDDLIELDRMCRESALLHFKEIKKKHSNILLFLNIESSILDKVAMSNHLIERVLDIGINPSDIVIEINESHIKDITALTSFVERYREYGFIISMDDVGAGFSNLNRIPLLGPDIIKIDRFILTNMDNDHYKMEVFKSLVELASNTGSLVVAEGTENESESILATELGADMIQGYYFSKPLSEFISEPVDEMITSFIGSYKLGMKQKNESKKNLIKKLNCISSSVVCGLEGLPDDEVEKILSIRIVNEADIECMYILNESGIQISDTVFKPGYQFKSRNILFLPAQKGTDHSLKGYYYHLVNNNNKNYISDKYMSMATGNMCITLTVLYKNNKGKTNILCIDFLA